MYLATIKKTFFSECYDIRASSLGEALKYAHKGEKNEFEWAEFNDMFVSIQLGMPFLIFFYNFMEGEWKVEDQLKFDITKYSIARFVYPFISDSIIWTLHRGEHLWRFARPFHLDHHRSRFTSLQEANILHPVDNFIQAVVPYALSMMLTLRVLGYKFSIWEFLFMWINGQMHGFSDHMNFEGFPLSSRFTDFWTSDASLGFTTNTTEEHNAHHHFLLCNYGIWGIVDRIMGTHKTLEQCILDHDKKVRSRLQKTKGISFRKAIWQKWSHIRGEDHHDMVQKNDFKMLCYDFGLYLSAKEADKIAIQLDALSVNEGYISYGDFLEWWLDNQIPALPLDEPDVEKRKRVAETFLKFDTDYSGRLNLQQLTKGFDEINKLLPVRSMAANASELLLKLDMDKNKEIDFNELIAAMSQLTLSLGSEGPKTLPAARRRSHKLNGGGLYN